MAHYSLSLDGTDYPISSADHLRQLLSTVGQRQYAEVFLTREDGSWIAALVNGDRAMLTFTSVDELENYYSFDPTLAASDKELNFLLSNGQLDQYPERNTVPTSEALQAVEYFYTTGGRAPWVHWINDQQIIAQN